MIVDFSIEIKFGVNIFGELYILQENDQYKPILHFD